MPCSSTFKNLSNDLKGFEMFQSWDQELRQELQQPEAGGMPVVPRALGSSQQSLDTSPGQTITWCQCRKSGFDNPAVGCVEL